MMLDPTAVSIAGIVTGGSVLVTLIIVLGVVLRRGRW